MKIDLLDLKHDAFAAPAGQCPSDHPMCMPPHSCAATRLALIARIQELERALAACHGVAGAIDIPDILERGVVLP